MDKHSRAKDITGIKFGRLTAIKREGRSKYNEALWLFQCDCGRMVITSGSRVANGRTKSCGCLQKETAKETVTKYNASENYKQPTRLTHGGRRTRLYNIWSKMKGRCDNTNQDNYKYYGGRGIKVCKEWEEDFSAFRDWSLSNGYKDGLTIDRIDTNGGYSPENCRWATVKEQQNNKRNNRLITIGGETKTMAQWAEDTGQGYKAMANKIYNGMSEEDAVGTTWLDKREKEND